MDHANEISVRLDGEVNQAPKLSDFVAVCDSLKDCLCNVSRCLIGKNAEFGIQELRTGSAILEVVPIANGVPLQAANEVARAFKATVRALQAGSAPDARLDYAALEAFKGFNRVAKRRDAGVAIDGIRLTESYSANLAELLQTSPPSLGSVRGRLEKVSVHSGRHFWLYPPIQNEKVKCSFDPKQLHEVLAAVDRSVTVYGKLRYAKAKAFPVDVAVDHFTVDPLDTDLPDLLASKGMLAEFPPRDELGAWRNGW